MIQYSIHSTFNPMAYISTKSRGCITCGSDSIDILLLNLFMYYYKVHVKYQNLTDRETVDKKKTVSPSAQNKKTTTIAEKKIFGLLVYNFFSEYFNLFIIDYAI